MSGLLPLPDTCQAALAAIEADPLILPPEVEAHLKTCVACSEVRVQWLAQLEAPTALAPAGYFERLPDRVLRKLPAQRSRRRHALPLWMAAAGLALALGVGGYLIGRAQPAPLTEAQVLLDSNELLPEVPFEETEDAVSEFSSLSPEEAEDVLQQLDASSSTPLP